MTKSMIRNNTLNTSCLALTIIAFGGIAQGCIPTDRSALAKYDTANYSPNTDGSGFAGLWVFTFNNESTDPDPYMGQYQRELIRLTPVAGAADTYEVTYCFSSIARTTVVASGNTIALPISQPGSQTLHDYSMTTDGHMQGYINLFSDYWRIWRAVRLSSNPNADAGTLGLDFVSDDAGTQTQPATCFSEWQEEPFFTAGEGYDLSSHYLFAAGESENGYAEIDVLKDATGPWVSARDEADRMFDGPIDVDTLQSTVQGIEGEVTTQGYDAPGGAVVFDVKL